LDKQDEDIIIQRLISSQVIILAGSAGSFNAIFSIIRALPSNFKPALVVVIHRGRNFFSDIINLFSDNCRISVCEIADKEKLTGGKVYIAPANYHTLFEDVGSFALDVSEQVWFSRPSIDVTFESAAEVFGRKCTAILYSGANQDGAAGLLKMRNAGGLTIVQDTSEAEMSTMPQSAIDINAAQFILNSSQILNLICR
jgi:two-component system chemotaxis response regulator CheB